VAYLAATRVGAITAGVNARLTPHERAAVLEIARPRLVITTAELAAPGTGAGADGGSAAGREPDPRERPTDAPGPGDERGPGTDDQPAGWDTVVVDLAPRAEQLLDGLREPGSWVDPLPADADRTVAIVFTSGTTGVPKGAVFTNRQIDFITAVDTGRRWGGGGAQLAGTSFAHLGPMTKLAGTLHRGGTIHLVDRWRADQALALVEQERMEGLGGIPTQIALMLREPNFDLYDLDCVRAIVIGGGPSTPALVREARARFGAALSVRYSCTEAGIGTGTAFDAPAEDAEVSVGRPHDGVILTIVGDDDEPVPAGGIGEVTLRSPP
jgi:acyl-coenzyme A synthetase/AMP-(fatty) acid ligase